MQWPRSVTELLDKVIASQPANVPTDEGHLNALSLALVSLEDELREQIQAVTAAQISPLIDTLQADGPLGPQDLELIRLWLVGDAETYVKMESDLAAWVAELDRLLGVLRQLRLEGVAPATLSRMEAAVRDALRVTGDILFYRQQEERVRSFENATKQLSRDDKQTLARILAQKLSSDAM